jgi:RHH-type transcriptional regulator, proline utilization regulon repressor / proline dehydrogenase / delta 1-pyrroline-5-carboxylate dehydrogenase
MARPTANSMRVSAALERRTQSIGRELFDRIGSGPRVWERAWWDDRLMDLTMGDPRVKVQLFRFIDALPALRTDEEVRTHLTEYLDEAKEHVAWWLKLSLRLALAGSIGARLLAKLARGGAIHMAHRFIAGETPGQALVTVRRLRRQRLAFTADLLGEAVISEAEADQYQAACLDLLRGLAGNLAADREIAQIDCDSSGPIPRVNLSLKLTSLTARFDALHAETTTERVLGRLRPIFREARSAGAFVNIDMEQYAYKDLTNAIVQAVLMEPEFRDWADVGVVAQAYLEETEDDLRSWLRYVERRETPITVRLVKGAYWDFEVLHAGQIGWPLPVHTEKWRTDASYERCAQLLVAHHDQLRPALGSHNVRSLSFGMAAAEEFGVPDAGYELQMLYGMGEPIQQALVEWGRRVRVYTPYGAMLPGMAYLVRRLLENTSNESFLKASFALRAQVDDLLRDPEEVGAMWGRKQTRKARPASNGKGSLPPFQNEPPTDFTKDEARERLRQALEEVRERLPFSCPLVIGSQHVRTNEALESTDPSETSRVVSQTSRAQAEHANAAVEAARNASADWSATPASERAAVLCRAAEIMRRERFTLAAIEVFECGKPWTEADADIAEAIDFCEFYAREMLRLSQTEHHDVAGETNAVEHIPRGVAVVIPPWNFPLAIPTGMTTAALVAGNTVILKPAEQSPAIAYQLVRILREAGLPPGALSYLPGLGEEVGEALVDHPGVDLIAFTGSRPVGLEINRRAAETKPGQDHVKRVIAEMGGKNAILIDADADLDEAVLGVLTSAFGYSGQKCSACSRVIALEGVYESFLTRLTATARDLTVGPAADPDTVVGPLIDADARGRLNRYEQIAAAEGQVVLSVDVGHLAGHGHFVGPSIVAGVSPRSRVAQEEIFGPLLAVLKARNLDEAIAIANDTDYALTGGLYSRSPANIEKVKQGFRVGNLYINRPLTGALVGRQPFGGFRLSGIGTKAGGHDYLHEFMLTRSVTENTMRRGFAPEIEIEASDGEQPATTGSTSTA